MFAQQIEKIIYWTVAWLASRHFWDKKWSPLRTKALQKQQTKAEETERRGFWELPNNCITFTLYHFHKICIILELFNFATKNMTFTFIVTNNIALPKNLKSLILHYIILLKTKFIMLYFSHYMILYKTSCETLYHRQHIVFLVFDFCPKNTTFTIFFVKNVRVTPLTQAWGRETRLVPGSQGSSSLTPHMPSESVKVKALKFESVSENVKVWQWKC